MISPEGLSIPEEELGVKKPEIASTSSETPAEYAGELRNKVAEASAKISDLERQRKLKAEIIVGEEDIAELKNMISEYNKLEDQLAEAREDLNEANVALETTIELGIKLPKAEAPSPEFDIDVSDLDNKISESMEAITEVTAMNDLITQRENIKSQLREAGASKDEVRFDELTDSYILLNEEIVALVNKETETIQKVETLTEIKKMAA
mgnify:CR=1 FL=1